MEKPFTQILHKKPSREPCVYDICNSYQVSYLLWLVAVCDYYLVVWILKLILV